ncbi:MAG: hypothetical protein AABX29_04905 [Nanoarchaeota archaeon]
MEFDELEESAEQELKRADHLIYVTLKYTRTVDVIKNTIKRLISAYDFAILNALKYLKVKEISDVPRVRVKQLEEKKPEFKSDMKFYLLLKELDAASFRRKDEYRKNVALITDIMDVNFEKLRSFFERTILFVKNIEELTKEKIIIKKTKKKKR